MRGAAAREQRVKAVGAGHSFSAAAATDGVLLDLRDHARVLHVDRERARVTVEAGIRLRALADALALVDLAFPNLGDIVYQSVSGATATGTHGTGARLGSLSSRIVGMRLVDGTGTVVELDAEREPELFAAARVGLGALGVVSSLTLELVPAFDLHAREGPERVDALLADLDANVDGNDHFEFFWVPHTGWALTKRNNRSERPRAPRPVWRALRDDLLYANVLFGAACRLGSLHPAWIPRLLRAVPGVGRVEYVDRSDRVFASPRWVRFVEMEYSIPRAHAAEALARVRAWVDASGVPIAFPVEVRFSAADDIPLSPAHGRETCWLAVHVYRRRGPAVWEPYFRAVEAIMDDYGGRPHWGKLHYQSAATLAPRYPEWDAFGAARERLDPQRVFANDYTERVLGP